VGIDLFVIIFILVFGTFSFLTLGERLPANGNTKGDGDEDMA